ncbi:MAG: Gfo/Idh/MocA family oxidoreductase [Rhodobacteraceae bacterium]|nr:Gfo/Idh/MocA family oxidoreductase [Paracoccaceae bacterium]
MPATRPPPLRLLIVGTGGMAAQHARSFSRIPGVTLVGGVDTDPGRRAAFADRFALPQSFASVEEALDWGGFDAATNVTPDRAHYPTTLPLIAAGKHVLCEKPLATSRADAQDMAARARAAGIVNGVNLSYRNLGVLQQAARLIRDGAIGEVRHFEASYLQSWLTQPAWGDWRAEEQWLWRLSTAHGSKGVLGDVGIHILDFLSFAAGLGIAEISCRLKTFPKAPGDRIGAYPLDANDSAVMHLALSNGAVGVVHATRFASGHLNDLRARIYGDRGGIEVALERGAGRLRLSAGEDLVAGRWRPLRSDPVPTVYRRFADAIRGGAPMEPDFARGAELQAALDRAEESAAAGGASLPV